MARKIIHQLVDDIDGELIDDGEGETVTFSIGGTAYEIDLSEKNAAGMREALDPWISKARRVPSSAAARGNGRAGRGGQRSTGAAKRDLTAVRTWARENGHEVSDRGRVPSTVLEAYDAAR